MRYQNVSKSGQWEWRHDCPYCEHADDQHHVCRDCNHEGHALCAGLTQSASSPLEYVPCHCTWIPGTPRTPAPPRALCFVCDREQGYCICPEFTEDPVTKIDTSLQNVESIAPETAAQILASFSDYVRFTIDHGVLHIPPLETPPAPETEAEAAIHPEPEDENPANP